MIYKNRITINIMDLLKPTLDSKSVAVAVARAGG
jgi:hypothetical protein